MTGVQTCALPIWVGLTDREKKKLIKEHVGHDCTVMPNEFIEVIEAKLKEKNT